MGLFSYPRSVLKSSGSEVIKTVLALENWLENDWDICSQSGQPLNIGVVYIVNM